MAEEDAIPDDRSAKPLVEGRTAVIPRADTNNFNYLDRVKSYEIFLTQIVQLYTKRKFKQLELADSVIPPLLDIALHCCWYMVEEEVVQKIIKLLVKLCTVSAIENKWCVGDVIEVLKKPWKKPVLSSMLHDSDELKINEVYEFVLQEGPILTTTRIRSLMENDLTRLCLNYVTWVYRCLTWEERVISEAIISIEKREFIIDIYVILLHDLKDFRDVFNVFKHFSCDGTMQAINRLGAKYKRPDIMTKVIHMLISKLALNVLGENEKTLRELISLLCTRSKESFDIPDLRKTLNSLCKLTLTSEHIYVIANEVYKHFSKDTAMVMFIIELYVRGITTDANNLDKAKCILKKPEKVKELGKRLSSIFQELAAIFEDVKLRREFLLNSFCVDPCEESLQMLQQIAEENSSLTKVSIVASIPNNCTWHSDVPGVTLCPCCGGMFTSNMPTPDPEDDHDPSRLLDPETTSLSSNLCDDLNVVLSSTRLQGLSWSVPWPDLVTRCSNYIDEYKNLNLSMLKELQYLNIDYNQFKDTPQNLRKFDPYFGVEKGYERFIEPIFNIDALEGTHDDAVIVIDDETQSNTTLPLTPSLPVPLPLLKCGSPPNSLSTMPPFVVRGPPNFDMDNSILKATLVQQQRLDPYKLMSSALPHYPPVHHPPIGEKWPSSDPLTLKNLRAFRPVMRKKTPKVLSTSPTVVIPAHKGDAVNVHSTSVSCVPFQNSPNVAGETPVVANQNLTNILNPRSLIDNEDNKRINQRDIWVNPIRKKFKDDDDMNGIHERFNGENNHLDDLSKPRSNYKKRVSRKRRSTDKFDDGNDSPDENGSRNKRELYANVMNLTGLDLVRPAPPQPVVRVVQVATQQAGQQNSEQISVPANISIPVSAHIQRVGQPNVVSIPKTTQDTSAVTTTTAIHSASTTTVVVTPTRTQGSIVSTVAMNNSCVDTTTANVSNVVVRGTTPTTSAQTSSLLQSSTPTLVNMLTQQRTTRPLGMPQEFTIRAPIPGRMRSLNFNIISDEIFQSAPTNPAITTTAPTVQTSIASTAIPTCSLSTAPTTSTTTIHTSFPSTSVKTCVTAASQRAATTFASTSQHAPTRLTNPPTSAVVSTGHHLVSFQQVVNSSQLLKTISSDGVKPLQLLYKMSDGKTFHITPVPTVAGNLRIQSPTQSPVKMTVKQSAAEFRIESTSQPQNLKTTTNTTVTSPRSGYEENYAKFIHIGRNVTTPNPPEISASPSLPKFQQAFGKTTSYPATSTTVTSAPSANTSTVVSAASTVASKEVLVVSTMESGSTPSTDTIQMNAAPLTVVSVPMAITSMITTNVTSAVTNVQRALSSTNIVRLVKPPTQSSTEKVVVADSDGESSNASNSGTVTIHQSPSAVLTPMRVTLPIVPRSTSTNNLLPTTRVVTPVLLRQRVVLAATTVAPTTIRLPQARVLTSNISSIEPSVSSSTLEQLREFDKVFEKVKERSTVQPGSSTPTSSASARDSTSSAPAAGYMGKLETVSVSQSTDEESTSSASTPIATFHSTSQVLQTQQQMETTSLVIGQPQQQRVSVAYVSSQLGQTLLSTCPPVVVVHPQPASAPSPALSVTSQSSSSPSLSSTPTSSSKSIQQQQLNKSITSSSPSKSIRTKVLKSNATSPIKASPVPKPQQKPQEDEGTAQRIYSILAEYAEQLRNSPDLNNKPAPRRRSNPPANPSHNSKRKKTSGSKKVSTNPASLEMSPSMEDHRTIGSEDSSCGVLQVSHMQDSPSHGVLSMDDAQSTEGSIDIPSMRGLQSDSNDCSERSQSQPAPTTRQLILAETSPAAGHRNMIITDSVVSEALAQVGKITNAATVLVPGNYLLPMSMMKGGHQITIVSGGSKILAVKPLKLPSIGAGSSGPGTSQQITTTQVLMPAISAASSTQKMSTTQVISRSGDQICVRTQSVTSGVANSNVETVNYSTAVLTLDTSKTTHTTTSVDMRARNIAESSATQPSTPLRLEPGTPINDPPTVSGSNGPLLSQLCEISERNSTAIILSDSSNVSGTVTDSPIHNGKADNDGMDNTKSCFPKKEWANHNLTENMSEQQEETSPVFRHSPGMQYASEASQTLAANPDKKRFAGSGTKLSVQAQRKQAAIERELRLQKSLSEECEDLGVDEPSASDLFPEAEILFDNTNQSPPFDNALQDATCSHAGDENLFNNTENDKSSAYEGHGDVESDDVDKSSSKMTLNDHAEYLLIHKEKANIKNGTNKFTNQSSNSSRSSYGDNTTLITNAPLISDVTIPSPLPQSTSYCLPSPYRTESPLTQATHSHIYTYSKKTNAKMGKKGRSYSLFESDCEVTSSSEVDSNSRTSVSTVGSKENDAGDVESISDSASEGRPENSRKKYNRKRPFNLYVYDENGVDASTFRCDKAATKHEHRGGGVAGVGSLPGTGAADDDDIDLAHADDDDDDTAAVASTTTTAGADDLESSGSSLQSLSDAEQTASGGSRRSSSRGHVKKGCPCCSGGSPPARKQRLGRVKSLSIGKKISGKKIS